MSARLRTADRPAVQWGAPAVLLLAGGVLLYHLTRGTSFLFDDWSYVLGRRGGSPATYLDPHNQHLSLIPIAIYKLLFATVGIGSYAPYRALVIVCHLACCALLFVYARTRIGTWPALLATAALLLLGPAWEDILWPFQMAWLISLGAGLGALLALDRRTRGGDALACALTIVALAGSGLGLPIALGIAVDVALGRRCRRDAWIIVAPLVLYALWWIGYQQGAGISSGSILSAPWFATREAASVAGSLFGLAGTIGLDQPGSLLAFGAPLLALGLVLGGVRLWQLGSVSPRMLALTTTLVTFWLATAISRAYLGNPYASRYIYLGALFGLLLAIELAQGLSLRWPVSAVLAVVALAAIASNVGILRTQASLLRDYGQATTADLGALEISRGLIPPGYIAHGLPGYPLVTVPARQFLALTHTLGNPAAGVGTIESDDEPTRVDVDGELIAIQRLAPVSNGQASRIGCRRRQAATQLIYPRGGIAVRAATAPVQVGVRRFADQFQPIGTVAAGSAGELHIAPDSAAVPWRLQLKSSGPITTCAG
jgi:hypothetical protein